MRARRFAAVAAFASALAVTVPSHAADQAVTVAALQFVQGGWISAVPFVDDTAVLVSPAVVPSYRKGDRVVFTNLDPLPHQVAKVSGPSNFPAMPTMGSVGGVPGTTSILATGGLAVGTYVYRCTVHPGMRGSFTLTA